MKKKLPQIKKDIKSFILNEDAKVINKAMTKITISTLAIGIGMAFGTQNVSAGHADHINRVFSVKDNMLNLGDTQTPKNQIELFGGDHRVSYSQKINIGEISPKSLRVIHVNHHNYQCHHCHGK